MTKKIKKILVVFVVIILLINISCISYSTNEEVSNVTSTNPLLSVTPSTENTSEADQQNALDELNKQKEEIQKQINENTSKVEYVQSEMSTTMEQVVKLNDVITQSESEITQLQSDLDGLQKSITTVSTELTKTEAEYNQKSKLLEERLVALYEAGDTTYLDVLLNSQGLLDFISNCYLITEVAEYDSQVIDEVEKQMSTIETKKNKLDAQKAELKIKKSTLIQKSITLQNNRTIQNNYIAKLSDDEKNLQGQIAQFQEQERVVETQIALAVSTATKGLSYPGGLMAWPVAKAGTYITSPFGMREHPITGVMKKHTGIDIANAGFGAPVIAAADGVVTFAGRLGGYGNCIIINHGDNISTLYGHSQKLLVEAGKTVKRGDLIMEVGSTGQSTGPHLHFEVRVNNTPVDPVPYLK